MSAAWLAVLLQKYPGWWYSENDMMCFTRPRNSSQHSRRVQRLLLRGKNVSGASRSLAFYCCTYHTYRIVIQYPGICQIPNTGTYSRGLCAFGNRKRLNPLIIWTRMNLGLLFHALVRVDHTVVSSVDWRS